MCIINNGAPILRIPPNYMKRIAALSKALTHILIEVRDSIGKRKLDRLRPLPANNGIRTDE
jgi:hypothetical protein